jgi:hypothetical protein
VVLPAAAEAGPEYPVVRAEEFLIAEPSTWQSKDCGVFRWKTSDSIMMIDFADRATQKKYVGRFGLYAAARNEMGVLYDLDYYRSRYTYEGNDLSPAKLAEFFTQAWREKTRLSTGEMFIRDLALIRGIITGQGPFLAGEGAIVSIHREFPAPSREGLLRHELYHALFYVYPDYRAACEAQFDRQDEDEIEYWKLLLGYKGRIDGRAGYVGYEVNDHYVLVNETQAILMQMAEDQVHGFFIERYLPLVRAIAPDKGAVLDRVELEHSTMFSRVRRKLAEAVVAKAGLRDPFLFARP